MKKYLMINFPVDLGNQTIESNFIELFKEDIDFFSFAKGHKSKYEKGQVVFWRSVFYRIASTIALRKIVRQYSRNGAIIIFNNISPALFSYGVWKKHQAILVFDWTRTLYPYIMGNTIEPGLIFRLHKKILHSVPKIFCWTDAIMHNLKDVYGVNPAILMKVPAPFLIEQLSMYPRATPAKPRVLFVGGDLKRKGGDLLLTAVKSGALGSCEVTMMTNDPSADIAEVKYLPSIKYGSSAHKAVFESNDILVLPTRMDAYPQVIGEAAAAGLAVVTTKFALGAPEVVDEGKSGFICETSEDCIKVLGELITDIPKINRFKQRGYELMNERFSRTAIRSAYLK